ncbi:MAG: iron ABC transporter permease [Burkholderiales bacterium]
MTNPRSPRTAWLLAALLAASVALIALGVAIGSTGAGSVAAIWRDPQAAQIIWDIRLPRTVGAWAAGALLGLAGAIAQGLFRNPLADPYLLGSASGATLAVALALAAFGGASAAGSWLARLGLTGAAFAGAMLGVLLTLALARGVQHTLRLLLAGVIVGVVLGAATNLVMLSAPNTLQSMQGFMLGSTSFVGWPASLLMLAVWLPCVIVAAALAQALDALALGESTAASLGLPLAPIRAVLVALLALATGAAVAQTGLIAFVGLAAPHLVRSITRTTHRGLIVLSSLMGGLLLAAADLLARWVVAPAEWPVGVLTAGIGGGYLLWLMHRRGWQGGAR